MEIFQNYQQWILCGELAQDLRKVPLQSCFELRRVGIRRDTLAISRSTQGREQISELAKSPSREEGKPAGFHVPEEGHKGIREESVRNACLYGVCATNYHLPPVVLGRFSRGCQKACFSNSRFTGNNEGRACPLR